MISIAASPKIVTFHKCETIQDDNEFAVENKGTSDTLISDSKGIGESEVSPIVQNVPNAYKHTIAFVCLCTSLQIV